MAALKGRGADRGSRITLLGLVANVGLTAVKGAAGYVLGSAVLLADAAHSGSDLIADVVTLVTYRLSMRPSSISHPYGYGKYETLGSLGVATLLIATALAIGAHSYHSLLLALMHVPSISPELIQAIDQLTLPGFLHDHGLPHDHHGGGGGGHSHDLVDEHGEIVDIRAAWFAGLSVVLKEWLYRATLKVAKETHSNVLLANAFHHRSDSFGSLVALGAIAGSWAGFPVLDPIGGLLVSGMILKNGFDVGVVSLKALVGASLDSFCTTRRSRLTAFLGVQTKSPTQRWRRLRTAPSPPCETPLSTRCRHSSKTRQAAASQRLDTTTSMSTSTATSMITSTSTGSRYPPRSASPSSPSLRSASSPLALHF